MGADQTGRHDASTDAGFVTPAFAPLPPVPLSTRTPPISQAGRAGSTADRHLGTLLLRALRLLARIRLAFQGGCAQEPTPHRQQGS
jgi:hypothetical protein